MSRRTQARGHLWLAGLGYLLFVVYGSLVPLDFRPMPLDAAIAAFRQVPWLQLGIGSRADWVANLLLFIPLAFLFVGALAHGRGVAARALASCLVLVVAVGLSLGIEFTQLFFPQRTVSQNDIAAESLGALLGVVAWWAVGRRFLDWYESWLHVRAPADLVQRLVLAYLALVFAYNVLPLDLTLSAVEVFHKWREGKLILVPFAGLPGDPAHALYELATDALIWLPPAFLWRYGGGRSTARAWWLAFAAALVLEVLQLFVFSRVSDVTDLFTAAFGAGAGALLGARLGAGAAAHPAARLSPASRAALPALLALAWIPVLILVFWYPFDFRADGAFVRERMAFLERVPFEVYYYGTEFRAITEVFHKVLFFAPLGVFLAWFVVGLPWLWRPYAAFASFLVILAAAVGIELGQVLLPGKFPDTTDMVLECLGGYIGYVLFRLFRTKFITNPIGKVKWRPAKSFQGNLLKIADTDNEASREEASPVKPKHLTGLSKAQVETLPSGGGFVSWQILGLGVGLLSMIVLVVSQLPTLPYNFREVVDPDGPASSALILSLFWFWFAGMPAAISRGLVSGRFMQRVYLPSIFFHAAIAAMLVTLAVPTESVDDLVGTPVLGWPGQIETIGRLTVLCATASVLLSGGAWLALSMAAGRQLAGFFFWVGSALIVLGMTYWVVVDQAATDNLTELMADKGGGKAFLVLVASGLLSATAASLLGLYLIGAGLSLRATLLWVILTLPVSYGLLHLGLEMHVSKYGQQFSALQFLLSPDRAHLVSGTELAVRYGLAWIAGIFLTTWAQAAFLRRVDHVFASF